MEGIDGLLTSPKEIAKFPEYYDLQVVWQPSHLNSETPIDVYQIINNISLVLVFLKISSTKKISLWTIYLNCYGDIAFGDIAKAS